MSILRSLGLGIVLTFFAAAVWAELPKGNPILPGRTAADPEIIFSEKTGLYYLYPTTEGDGFRAFSSDDLVHWKDEGIILSLKDVVWEEKNSWAPSMLETKIDGEYRYFFYFCAGEKIGVASSESPTGPFTDSGAPLIDTLPEGVTSGVPIDPDAFTDPVSGKTYLYWGNGSLSVCELSDDFLSLRRETMKLITPPDYFEAPHVFYRDGIYYLSWSQNDTRSVDYRVRYLIADSPTGPFHLPDGVTDNIILQKRPKTEIYGTGHHSVVQIPGTDSWRIFYHRLCLPIGKSPWAREVCADVLKFNPDGSIIPVKPTRKGMKPGRIKTNTGN